MTNNSKYILISLYSLVIASFLICSFFSCLEGEKIIFFVTAILIFIMYFCKFHSFYHPLFLFFFTFYYFIGGGIIIDLFSSSYNFADTSFFTTYTFDKDIQIKMMNIFNIVQFAMFFSVLIPSGKSKSISIYIEDNQVKQFFILVFIVATILKVWSVLLVIKQVFAEGYISIYLHPVQLPPFLRMGDDLLVPAMGLLLLANLTCRELKISCGIFVIVSILSLFTGSRASGITLLLSAICILNMNFKLSNKSFLRFAVILLVLILFVQFVRINDSISLGDVLSNFVGSIIPTVGYGVQYEDKFTTDGFCIFVNIIISYINYFLVAATGAGFLPNFPDGPSSLLALKGFDSAARISYYANSKFYLAGMGMGTSCFLEYYWLAGYFGVFIFTTMSMYFFIKLNKRYKSSLVCRFLYIIFLGGWLLSNRTSALEFMNLFYLAKFLPLLLMLFLFKYSKERKAK